MKKVPQGYDPALKQAEYLKNKSWYLESNVPDDMFLREDFIEQAMDIFKAMQPFQAYLNRALKDFVMPVR